MTKNSPFLPPEVLVLIIANLVPPAHRYERADWSSRELEVESATASPVLYRVCLINRLWYSVANQMLYDRVVLGTVRQAQRFCKALSRTPALQKLVRELIVFDATQDSGFLTPSWVNRGNLYYHVVMERLYRAHTNQMRKQVACIISMCLRLERISLHLCSASGQEYSLTPDLFCGLEGQESDVHILPLRRLLITGVPPNSHCLSTQAPYLSNLETLTLFKTDISASFLKTIPSGLSMLRSFNLIHVKIRHDHNRNNSRPFQQMQYLKTLRLVDTSTGLPDVQPNTARVRAWSCPENLERLSLVSSKCDLDGLLSIWPQLGVFSQTSKDLCIPMLHHESPIIELPPSLTTLAIVFDSYYNSNKYLPIMHQVRTLLKKNRAILHSRSLKTLTLVVPPAAVELSYDNWLSPYIRVEETLLRALCHKHNIRLYKTTVPDRCQWLLNEAEGGPMLSDVTTVPYE